MRERVYRICFIIVPLVGMLVAGVVGWLGLLDTPRIGVRFSFARNGNIVVANVDEGGPAENKLFSGDVVQTIGTVSLHRDDLLRFPEFTRIADEEEWWHRQQLISEQLRARRLLPVTVVGAEQRERTVWIQSQAPTWSGLFLRVWPIYLAGLILAGMSIIMYSYGRDGLHRVSQIFFMSLGVYHMAILPAVSKEIALDPRVARLLTEMAFVAAGGWITLVHFALIFPRRKRWLDDHPRLIWIPYFYFGATVALYLLRITAFGSTYMFLNVWGGVVIAATVHGYWAEGDRLLKQQILLFLLIPILLVSFFCLYIVMPGVMRTNMADYAYFAVFSLALCFSIALAVENQKLYLETLAAEQRNLRERFQMAREIHDNFCNVLTGIALVAERHGAQTAAHGGPVAMPYQIRDAARMCLQDVRDFIAAVDPVPRRWKEFADQCRNRIEELFRPLDIRLDFSAEFDQENALLRPPVQYHLIGIMREAVGNIVKHAGAKRVSVKLAVHAQQGELRVADDGRGVDVAAVEATSRGLRNMRKRAEEIDGCLFIESAGSGTMVRATFRP